MDENIVEFCDSKTVIIDMKESVGEIASKVWPVVTPPRNRGGVIFSLQFVCVSVCLCVRHFL